MDDASQRDMRDVDLASLQKAFAAENQKTRRRTMVELQHHQNEALAQASANGDLRVIVEELTRSRNHWIAEMKAAREETAKVKAENVQLKDRCTAQVADLRKELQFERDSETTQLRAEIAALRQRVSATKKKHKEEMEHALSRAQEEMHRVLNDARTAHAREVDILRADLAHERSKVATASTREAEKARSTAELTETKRKIELEHERSKATLESEVLKSKLEASMRETEKLKETLREREASLEEHADAIAEAHREIKRVHQRTTNTVDAEAATEGLKQEIKKYQSATSDLVRKHAAKYESWEEERQESHQHALALEREISTLRRQLETMSLERSEARETMRSLKAASLDSMAEKEDITQRSLDLKMRLSHLEEDNARLRATAFRSDTLVSRFNSPRDTHFVNNRSSAISHLGLSGVGVAALNDELGIGLTYRTVSPMKSIM